MWFRAEDHFLNAVVGYNEPQAHCSWSCHLLALFQMCLFILFNKYIDSTYYMLGTVLSALQIVIHLALITSLEVGTIIIPTDDDTKAHSITNLLRVLTASK